MTYSDTEHRARLHQHCLWLAERDARYAQAAAKLYEDSSDGVLFGLAARVARDVQKMQIEGKK